MRRISAALAVLCLLALATPRSIGAQPATPVTGDDVTIHHDVTYGEADGIDLLLDVYVPDGDDGPYAAVLVIHGGAWRSGSKESFADLSERLAQEGFVVFNVEYRLAPPGGHWHAPAAIDDVRQALRWVRDNAPAYDADPVRVGALGSSAGANLALLLATTGEPGVDRVDVAVSWSGPTDLVALAESEGNEVVGGYIGCDPLTCPDTWEAASPLSQVDPADAPIYLANSTDELIPLEQATSMAAALDQAGVPYQLRVLDGRRHARAYANAVWDESVAFLQTYLDDLP